MLHLDRHRQTVLFLIQHGLTASSSSLSEEMGVSSRTIRSDIVKINRELRPFGARIVSKRGEGYRLDIKPAELSRLKDSLRLTQSDPLDSPSKRQKYLTCLLLTSDSPLGIEDLASCVYVSQDTALAYLKHIRALLAERGLSLHAKGGLGYMAGGDELGVRSLLLEQLISDDLRGSLRFGSLCRIFIAPEDLAASLDAIRTFVGGIGAHFSDFDLKDSALYLAISVTRVKAGHELPSSLGNVPIIKARADGAPLFEQVEKRCDISLSRSERDVLLTRIVIDSHFSLAAEQDDDRSQKLVDRMLSYIQETYHFDLRGDEALVDGLTNHIRSVSSLQGWAPHQRKPLLNTIKRAYPLPFEIASTTMHAVLPEEEADALDESDIGYIALHIGAAIERSLVIPAKSPRKRVAVLYGGSRAEADLVMARLSSQYGDQMEALGPWPLNELDEMRRVGADFAVSTAPVPESLDIPVAISDMAVSGRSALEIKRLLAQGDDDPLDRILHFFSPELFIRLSAHDKDEVIDALCHLVEDAGYAREGFRESVLERESHIATAMDGMVAIPHPLDGFSTTSKIAVCLLDQPVRWSEDLKAQIILMLSLSDDRDSIMLLYDALVDIMSNAGLESRLAQAADLDEFLAVLGEHLNSRYT